MQPNELISLPNQQLGQPVHNGDQQIVPIVTSPQDPINLQGFSNHYQTPSQVDMNLLVPTIPHTSTTYMDFLQSGINGMNGNNYPPQPENIQSTSQTNFQPLTAPFNPNNMQTNPYYSGMFCSNFFANKPGQFYECENDTTAESENEEEGFDHSSSCEDSTRMETDEGAYQSTTTSQHFDNPRDESIIAQFPPIADERGQPLGTTTMLTVTNSREITADDSDGEGMPIGSISTVDVHVNKEDVIDEGAYLSFGPSIDEGNEDDPQKVLNYTDPMMASTANNTPVSLAKIIIGL